MSNPYAFLLICCCLFGCAKEPTMDEEEKEDTLYKISGLVVDSLGKGISNIRMYYSKNEFVLSNEEGQWEMEGLQGTVQLIPQDSQYSFMPESISVDSKRSNIKFSAERKIGKVEDQIYRWLLKQQLDNGLLESSDDGKIVSLYDNALAALAFTEKGAWQRAEAIFDFFDARIESELQRGIGGFSQLRNAQGAPFNHRWMGDNAWLLIAINHYHHKTGNKKYAALATAISGWLRSLQDQDGGLFAGYDANDELLDYKVSEGNIDAFNAIDGYTDFHQKLLEYLEHNRWRAEESSLVSWPENPVYLYALDLHPWSYLMFPRFPVATLSAADRFINTQKTEMGTAITGYCFDEDKDVVWLEGTAQMALALGFAENIWDKNYYLNEMEKAFIESDKYKDAGGFPYTSNQGTSYGAGQLWEKASSEIALSSGAWYLFAKWNFNPFVLGRSKDIPNKEMFWLQ